MGFVLRVEQQVRIENQIVNTRMCRERFPMSEEPALQCYLSDHYGLSVRLRLRPIGFPQ
jgi:endonuclease/exonuclease/phosphatase family metal-dependent hydrolase